MFRELSRKNKQLPQKECIALLQREVRGVLSVLGENGYPYGMPMNHFYNEDDGCIYFHSGMTGHKIDALRAQSKVSFCVYDSGYRNADEWALNIKSVIVFGEIECIDDRATVADITRRLSLKFTRDTDYIEREIHAFAHKTLLLKLTPAHMTGKLVNES